ncbi:MAG: hypothetical protein WBO37_06685, partial [Gammaproteobacteria bacterium]
MQHSYRKLAGPALAALLAISQLVFVPAAAAGALADENGPSGGAMLADMFMIRPTMLVGTAVGLVTFVVSLPFTALGGNVDQAADQLVMRPVKYTFVRP